MSTKESNNKLGVLNSKGEEVSAIDIKSADELTSTELGLIHQSIRRILASRRAGTHSVLTRSGVKASGKKPFKQKGTGRARAGTVASPLWVGGGVAHGPSPRDYNFKINRKEALKASECSLRQRIIEGNFIVLDKLELSEISTKEAASILSSIGVEKGEKILLVVSDENEIIAKSFRNIEGVNLASPNAINAHNILSTQKIVVDEATAKVVLERFKQLN